MTRLFLPLPYIPTVPKTCDPATIATTVALVRRYFPDFNVEPSADVNELMVILSNDCWSGS